VIYDRDAPAPIGSKAINMPFKFLALITITTNPCLVCSCAYEITKWISGTRYYLAKFCIVLKQAGYSRKKSRLFASVFVKFVIITTHVASEVFFYSAGFSGTGSSQCEKSFILNSFIKDGFVCFVVKDIVKNDTSRIVVKLYIHFFFPSIRLHGLVGSRVPQVAFPDRLSIGL